MNPRTPPYHHFDGSNCWTKNCKLGNTAQLGAPKDAINHPDLLPTIHPRGQNPHWEEEWEKREHLFNSDPDILLIAPSGSHLYGLAHENSDMDFITVRKDGKTAQKIVGDNDDRVFTEKTFLQQTQNGVPIALEALFAQMPVGTRMSAYSKNLIVGFDAWTQYLKPIAYFMRPSKRTKTPAEEVKRKRHATRLVLNLNDIIKYGRFNPTLTNKERTLVYSMGAIKDQETFTTELQKLSTLKLDK